MQTSFGPFSTIHKMLEYALNLVLDAVRAEAGGVYLLDEDREALELTVHRGLPAARVREIEHLELGQGLTGRVALTGKPIVIRNVKGILSFASVPLRSNFRTYGTLNIQTRANQAFSKRNLQLVTSMACQIGLAVANDRACAEHQAPAAFTGGSTYSRVARAQTSRLPAALSRA